MSWFARLRERVFAPHKLQPRTLCTGDDPNCFYRHKIPAGTAWRNAVPLAQPRAHPDAPSGYSVPLVTEILPWNTSEPPRDSDGNSLRDMVGRPTGGHWPTISMALWPRPDPSKRWRLFIQEDTR